jgi:hypothetical protein
MVLYIDMAEYSRDSVWYLEVIETWPSTLGIPCGTVYRHMAEYSRKSLWYLEVSLGTPEICHSSSWYPWGILVVKRHKDSLWYPCGTLWYPCGTLWYPCGSLW